MAKGCLLPERVGGPTELWQDEHRVPRRFRVGNGSAGRVGGLTDLRQAAGTRPDRRFNVECESHALVAVGNRRKLSRTPLSASILL
jgi:hypothetical protein